MKNRQGEAPDWNGEAPDCGSLLPLVQGSLLPCASLWQTKLWRYRVGGAFSLRIAPTGLPPAGLAPTSGSRLPPSGGGCCPLKVVHLSECLASFSLTLGSLLSHPRLLECFSALIHINLARHPSRPKASADASPAT